MPNCVSRRRAAILATLTLLAGPALAASPKPPTIDRIRAYLIWEDSGELSKNLASAKDQIVANTEKGTSAQMLVDVVLTAKGDSLYSGKQPFLYIYVTPMGAQVGDPPMLDTGFPITYIAKGGELTRSVIVEHGCNGFSFSARVMVEDKIISEFNKDYSITCGD